MCVPCRFQRSFVLLKVLCGDNRTSYHKLWWARLYICVTKNVSTFHQTMAALALFSLYPCKEQHEQDLIVHCVTNMSALCILLSSNSFSSLFLYPYKSSQVVVCKAKPHCTFVSSKFLHGTSSAFIKQQQQLLDLINIIATDSIIMICFSN